MMRLALALVSLMIAAGRQLTGVYTPAQTPALKPEEAATKFSVPEGFEVRIFYEHQTHLRVLRLERRR